MTRIARAQRLLAVARDSARLAADRLLSFDVQLVRFDAKGQPRPVGFEDRGRVLFKGETVGFRIANQSRVPIDVTLLVVDASYGIQSIFPKYGRVEDNRVPAGRSVVVPDVVVEEPLGTEQVVAIAVRAGSRPVSFSVLEQAGLTPFRGVFDESPIGRLLASAVEGSSATRAVGGLTAPQLYDYATRVLTWRTVARDPR